MVKVYIIRHCEAEGNVKEFFQGVTDCDITERGQLQLELLGKRFSETHVDLIYTSPLKRARLTAEAVKGGRRIDIITDSMLREINVGEMEGQYWDKLPDMFPDTYNTWVNDIGNFQSPGGESVREVYRRLNTAFDGIIRKNEGKTLAVVSHGCAIYMLMSRFYGYGEDKISHRAFWCNNTAVSLVSFDGGLNPTVEYFNDDSHIKAVEKARSKEAKWIDHNNKRIPAKPL